MWPQDETFWQKKTAEFLLALNKNNGDVMPPLLQQSAKLPPEGKTWQEALNHYDALVSYKAATPRANMDSNVDSSSKGDSRHHFVEEDDLLAMSREMAELLPAQQTASTQ